jgi:hypothetical protein
VSALSLNQSISRTVASGLALFSRGIALIYGVRRRFCLPVGIYSRQWRYLFLDIGLIADDMAIVQMIQK